MQRPISSCLAIFMLAFMVTGCALSTFKAKTGSGDSGAPRAIIKTEKDAAISSIDGKTVFITSSNWWIPLVTKTKASVLPGEHTLLIKYVKTGWSSSGIETVLNAKPGKTYVLKVERLDAEPKEGELVLIAVKKPQAVRIKVWTEEMTNEKEG